MHTHTYTHINSKDKRKFSKPSPQFSWFEFLPLAAAKSSLITCFYFKERFSIPLPLYFEINILVHLQIHHFNLFLVQRQSSNVTPACRTLIFEAFLGELREGVNFQLWFQSPVQHFQVCFVLSELLRSGRRLQLQGLRRRTCQ